MEFFQKNKEKYISKNEFFRIENMNININGNLSLFGADWVR